MLTLCGVIFAKVNILNLRTLLHHVHNCGRCGRLHRIQEKGKGMCTWGWVGAGALFIYLTTCVMALRFDEQRLLYSSSE